jgi:outer membrane lipoprotein LolB
MDAAAQPSRRLALILGGAALLAASGCATVIKPLNGADAKAWTGRMALRIESEPEQTFAALFELRGTAETGELTLTSPIGSTLAALRWAPGEAVLNDGGRARRFDSVDLLIQAATGAPIPVGALFGWLEGRNAQVSGWKAELGQLAQGRLQARREAPLPSADLRVVFERA